MSTLQIYLLMLYVLITLYSFLIIISMILKIKYWNNKAKNIKKISKELEDSSQSLDEAHKKCKRRRHRTRKQNQFYF